MKMPGSNYAENANGESGVAQMYGVVAAELYGSSGEALQLESGKPATISYTVPSNLLGSAPSTVSMFYFDEENGYWIEEGTATLNNGVYSGEVSHFSFWGMGFWADEATLAGHIEDIGGNPLLGSVVFNLLQFSFTDE